MQYNLLEYEKIFVLVFFAILKEDKYKNSKVLQYFNDPGAIIHNEKSSLTGSFITCAKNARLSRTCIFANLNEVKNGKTEMRLLSIILPSIRFLCR